MGETISAHVLLIIGVIFVNATICDRWNQTTGNLRAKVEKDMNLLCEKLEEEQFDQNKTLFKLKLLPVDIVFSQVKSLLNVGLFSPSFSLSERQIEELVTVQWIEDQFEKEQQKRLEKKKSAMLLTKTLLVNALVIVDQALDNMLENSSQFVEDFFPLVNHILGSVGIKIRISDVLIETSSRNFNFVKPLDNKTGMVNLWQKLPDSVTQNIDDNIVLVMSGLDICWGGWAPWEDGKGCSTLLGIAEQWWSVILPFFRTHDCTYKTAIVEVQNLTDRIGKWRTAVTAAHEVVHLIGTTNHDGEGVWWGGGPGSQSCHAFNQYVMAPGSSVFQLFRMCEDYELWSPCTIQQVKFFTANWTRFCPGSFFTYHENPLMGLLLLPLAAFAALVYFCKRKRSKAEKTKKLLEDEAERMTEEQMVTMVS